MIACYRSSIVYSAQLDVKIENGDSEVVVVRKRKSIGEDESLEKKERDRTLKRLYLL